MLHGTRAIKEDGLLESGLTQAAAHGADVTVLDVVVPRVWRVGRLGPVRGIPSTPADPLESAVLRDARVGATAVHRG